MHLMYVMRSISNQVYTCTVQGYGIEFILKYAIIPNGILKFKLNIY